MIRTTASEHVHGTGGKAQHETQKPIYPGDYGLRRRDFRKVSENGWGDRFNAYAYSMAWFKDALYVGNSRGNLAMIHRNHPTWMKTWPIRLPREFHDFDFRAQIWRYAPSLRQWGRVYRSPHVPGANGKPVPRDMGYRSMTLFKGGLHVASFAPASAGLAPKILRSLDGRSFDTLSSAGIDPALNTYRILQVFKDKLYTSPTGRIGGETNSSKAAVVLESCDDELRVWQAVSDIGFGDPDNETFFEMAVFNNHLYVGTLNPVTGFQVWKTACGRKPYRWIQVIRNGAYRNNLNELVISMCVFKGALYVGTAIQNGGYDQTHKIGPAAPELIRIFPDDSWELIVGQPRSTPEGNKFPISGRGPGFGNPFNGYFWRMAVHDGWLYLGTYKWTIFLPYVSRDGWSSEFRDIVDKLDVDHLAYLAGGFDLWRSPDGANWFPVTRNGFDNPYNHGVRTLQSTPHGLFIGTANPFGPDIAVRARSSGGGQTRWTFQPNYHGGLEIWLGAKIA